MIYVGVLILLGCNPVSLKRKYPFTIQRAHHKHPYAIAMYKLTVSGEASYDVKTIITNKYFWTPKSYREGNIGIENVNKIYMSY